MQRRKPLGARPPDPEARFWQRLRELDAEGAEFRKDAPWRSFTLPFVEHDAQLVIVLEDGDPGPQASPSPNIVRDRLLREEGYSILRLWKGDVAANLSGAIATIAEILDARRRVSPETVQETPPQVLPPAALRDDE